MEDKVDLKSLINKGLEGKNRGLDNGFKRLNNYIFGIQRSCYTLLGGLSGTYKTTLCDYIVQSGIKDADAKGIPLNIWYYSYEIPKDRKLALWLSNTIYRKTKIVIPEKKILNRGEGCEMTEKEIDLCNQFIDEVQESFKRINFRFEKENPTGIYHELWQHALNNGTLIYEPYTDAGGQTKNRVVGYTPNDPKVFNLVVVDHVGLLKLEREFGLKEVIDKYSEYCVILRNLFGYSFINVQQFNQGLNMLKFVKMFV